MYSEWEERNEEVIKNGGLHIVVLNGMNREESIINCADVLVDRAIQDLVAFFSP